MAIELYSASWFTYRGPGRVGISLGTPRNMLRGYRIYRQLAPERYMLGLDYDAYLKAYHNEVLDRLNPVLVLDQLQHLAGDAVPVILCWEKPPLDTVNFCHRTMAREWLGQALGIETAEWSPDVGIPARPDAAG